MKYVMLIMDTPNEPAPNTPEWGAWYAEVGAWYEKWGATGRLDGGHQLQGADSAYQAPYSGLPAAGSAAVSMISMTYFTCVSLSSRCPA